MAGRTFFGTVRLALLLAVLVFVAVNAWLDRRRSTDWDGTLRVTVYPLPASPDTAVSGYIARLTSEDFADIGEFFAHQGRNYGLEIQEPVRVRVSHAAREAPPVLAENAGVFTVIAWSLQMRYWAWRVAADDPLPTPDIQVFALYHTVDGGAALPDSLGTTKGLMAVAHVYAEDDAAGSNDVVIVHELLHTLGATDKYDRATGQPLVPDGLGDPDQRPAFPQTSGEVMAGRIAISAREAVIPASLTDVTIGPVTAREIGWSSGS